MTESAFNDTLAQLVHQTVRAKEAGRPLDDRGLESMAQFLEACDEPDHHARATLVAMGITEGVLP